MAKWLGLILSVSHCYLVVKIPDSIANLNQMCVLYLYFEAVYNVFLLLIDSSPALVFLELPISPSLSFCQSEFISTFGSFPFHICLSFALLYFSEYLYTVYLSFFFPSLLTKCLDVLSFLFILIFHLITALQCHDISRISFPYC